MEKYGEYTKYHQVLKKETKKKGRELKSEAFLSFADQMFKNNPNPYVSKNGKED